MKKMILLLTSAMIIASCSSTKNTAGDSTNTRTVKKLAEQAAIKQAVESRRYIIKVNRIYLFGGGFNDLYPRRNFIVVDGELASVSLGYSGRTFLSRPISGISFNGRTIKYDMVSNESKGKYDITLKTSEGTDTFTFFITIMKSGECTVSVQNAHIESVNYRGQVVPVQPTAVVSEKK
ncbi:MAG TPA: DUF4251 domain-containing protein [Bacteroidales bacterium]|nr:DUF4251 domain-containing protein [Bacteroidales bacterium]